MQPPFDLVADLDTPVSAFLKLAPLHPRYLLESVEGGERVGRWSFLGFGETREVRLDAAGWHEEGVTRPAPADAAGLKVAMRGALARAFRPGPLARGVPFPGGLVTAAGWDIIRWFEHLPTDRPGRDLPTFLGMSTRSLLVFDHASRRAAVLHDGGEDERRAVRDEVRRLLAGGLPPRPAGPFSLAPPTPTLSASSFHDVVDAIHAAIGRGDVYQLVASIGFDGATDLPPFEVYRALRLLNPSPYMVYVDWGDVTLVGSSPEALVRLAGRAATLRPIAGTRPRGATAEADVEAEQALLADPKEAAEHVMLVDLARNDLGRVAVGGSVVVRPYRTIERYSHVMHIVSGVEGTLRDEVDAFDLFEAAFPAGTVVGAPKVRAVALLDELEPVARGFYAGTVGYFGHDGGMDQAIAIRTLCFTPGRYQVQAGAGVVADSVAAAEYAEIQAKSAALYAALSLAQQALASGSFG
jgi:anthranilate synthase component 1